MLQIDKLVKALEIIETITKAEYVSVELFSDGSGHILDSNAIIVLQWDTLDKVESLITDYIYKKS